MNRPSDDDIAEVEHLLLTPPYPSIDDFRRWVKRQRDGSPWHAVFASDFGRLTREVYRVVYTRDHSELRQKQITAGGFEFLIYRADLECQDHARLDRAILPRDHPFWRVLTPPNGPNCDCRVHGAHTISGSQRRGGDPDLPAITDRNNLAALLATVPGEYIGTIPPNLRDWLIKQGIRER